MGSGRRETNRAHEQSVQARDKLAPLESGVTSPSGDGDPGKCVKQEEGNMTFGFGKITQAAA